MRRITKEVQVRASLIQGEHLRGGRGQLYYRRNEGRTHGIFWEFSRAYRMDSDGDEILSTTCCKEIEQDLWLHIGNLLWRKNWSVLNEYLK